MVYPFTSDQVMVRNRWYIAAFSDEITREPMERTILGKPVVFYRTEAGAAVAMYGICPHRYFPLAQGKLEGDAIVCGYHGFKFDFNGKCIDIPSQGTGSGFCQPSYRIEERGSLCWIWMGDQDVCDPALIPPYEDFGLEQPGWYDSSYNYCLIKGRPQLLVDNLMDLTHLPYVHHHIKGAEGMKDPTLTQEERNGFFNVIREMPLYWNPFHELIYGKDAKFEGEARVENATAVYGPELIRTGLGTIQSIDGDTNIPPELGTIHILHGITPESENSVHYFGFSTRDFRLGDKGLDEFQLNSDVKIRGQDKVAIEAVETRLDASAKLQQELLVKSDIGAVKVRKIIQGMLDAEASQDA
ncbi:MAG: aromatic ring-hydroxylating dioxygenase subunit alpha [Parasphingorhabdus sp.]|uniref:aromatic ring-hydroxylating dioxygenase subunit alpha n=1 Tax=Parasphingorhabdus sp. TaxID=2709688 RepID=UPI00326762E9